MVSLFSSLNIASNALSVNESAISVVSHNVANMNTEGYSKQRANLATRNIAGAIGDNVQNQIRANGGVMIANVMRYNDSYLNNYYRDQLSTLKQYEEQLGSLGDLAEVFNDLDGNGISEALSNLYTSLNNLNEYPASAAARTNFIQSAKTLTSILNSKNIQLEQLGSQILGDGSDPEKLLNSKIYAKIENYNDALDELAAINKALQVTQTGTLEANNLLDKRDMALNKIAEFVNINVVEKKNGTVDVYTGDNLLVEGSVVKGALQIETAQQYCKAHSDEYPNYPEDWVYEDGTPRPNAVVNFVSKSGKTTTVVKEYVNDEITSGSLGGMLHAADLNGEGINVGTVRESLNDLALELADMFNTLNTRENAYCINPDNTRELKATWAENVIFIDGDSSGSITAGNIAINPEFLKDDGCWNVACAYFEDPLNAIGEEHAVGNSANVVAMLMTRNEPRDNLKGMSLEDFYNNLVGKIGATSSNAQNLVDTQQNVVDSIGNQISANNSVDLNEELVDLVKYQTAYAASAQVFNVANRCLDVLMTLGG